MLAFVNENLFHNTFDIPAIMETIFWSNTFLTISYLVLVWKTTTNYWRNTKIFWYKSNRQVHLLAILRNSVAHDAVCQPRFGKGRSRRIILFSVWTITFPIDQCSLHCLIVPYNLCRISTQQMSFFKWRHLFFFMTGIRFGTVEQCLLFDKRVWVMKSD